MARIWANCVEKKTKKYSDCPARYKNDMKQFLYDDTAAGINEMTPERYEEITGEPFVPVNNGESEE